MAEYIEALRGPQDALVNHSSHFSSQSIDSVDLTSNFRFPILASLLQDFVDMGEANKRSGKGSGRRGRKPHAKVPCDECIARASQKNEPNASLELCESCTSVLHRLRARKQPEQANTRKVRKQSHTVIDTALGIHTEPVAMPCEYNTFTLARRRKNHADGYVAGSNDRQEQHSLNFFVRHSAPQLAGYFDSPFW